MGPPFFFPHPALPPSPLFLADWLRLGLGINRHGALQGFGLGLLNANANVSQLNGTAAIPWLRALSLLGFQAWGLCSLSLYLSLGQSVRKPRLIGVWWFLCEYCKGLNWSLSLSFPLSHYMIMALGFLFFSFHLINGFYQVIHTPNSYPLYPHGAPCMGVFVFIGALMHYFGACRWV